MTTTAKVERKPRARKPKTAIEIMSIIDEQQLKVNVELLSLLKTSIEEDKKALQVQLDLIAGTKPLGPGLDQPN